MLLDWEVSGSICKSLCRSLTPCCVMLLSPFLIPKAFLLCILSRNCILLFSELKRRVWERVLLNSQERQWLQQKLQVETVEARGSEKETKGKHHFLHSWPASFDFISLTYSQLEVKPPDTQGEVSSIRLANNTKVIERCPYHRPKLLEMVLHGFVHLGLTSISIGMTEWLEGNVLSRYFLGRLTSMFPQECTCIINLEACGGVTVHEAKTGIFHI